MIHVSKTSSTASASTKHAAHIVRDWLCRAHEVRDPVRYITGHESTGQDGSYALGHREKVIDFGYRAAHEMTVNAKLIIAAYYGRSP